MPLALGMPATLRRCLAVAAVAVGAIATFATPALGAGPIWGIKMTHANPYGQQGVRDPYTNSGSTFARDSAGDDYEITVENKGEETKGQVKVVDKLPAGLVLFAFEVNGVPPAPVEAMVERGPEWTCTTGGETEGPVIIKDASEVECVTSKVLKTGESYTPITLNVSASLQAAPPAADIGTLTNVATVSGGSGVEGASTTEAEGATTITPAVPFGFASFATSVEELESPFGAPSVANPLKQQQQAGGHPYQYTTALILNYTASSKTSVAGASGGPKAIEVELPPGFVGDVQNTPRCPAVLLPQGCPLDTAVGYLQAASPAAGLSGGKVITFLSGAQHIKEKESLLWNVAPAPGNPAAFGFIIDSGIPFVLEAKVRSGRDYGVTVGDNATSNTPPVLASQVVTCENGATEVTPTDRVCNTAPAGARPFLTNPTNCSASAPVTTALADSWDEPKSYASMEAYANAPSAQEHSQAGRSPTHGNPVQGSLVTGCDQLEFNPKIEFGQSAPSDGGTRQADEPTGVTLNLAVPQTDEVGKNATPDLRKVSMTLPEGLTASPSAADGLQACSKSQFWPAKDNEKGEAEEPSPAEHREPAVPAECPTASQLGTVEVFTPLLSGAPAAEGLLEAIGKELTCTHGDWSGAPQLSYQWLRNGQPISGASGEHYVPVVGDPQDAIQCQVTATTESGSSVAMTPPAVAKRPSEEALRKEGKTAPGLPLPPSSIAAPSGTPAAGSTLTCENGAWTGKPTSFVYQWLRGGTPISGASSGPTAATSFTYTLQPADEGKVIQCQVLGNDESEVEVGGGKKEKVGGVALADSAAVVVSPAPSTPPPLPGAPLQGQVFQGQPECSPCTPEDAQDGRMLPLFIQLQDPLGLPPGEQGGVIVKLAGKTTINTATGRLTSVFEEQPQQPFELLQLKLKGGPRAPLANPQSCAAATTSADLTPWSAPGVGGLSGTEPIPGTPDALPSSPFNVEGCPATMPFAPSFNAGTTGPTATLAGASTSFSVTFGRDDREQDLSGVTVHMPLGLVGKIPAVTLCGEAEALAQKEEAPTEGQARPHCPAGSEIGKAISLAGPGSDPFKSEGKVYLTRPIKRGPFPGAPFGLLVDTPAEAGPFNLGHVVILSGITIDPNTAAVSVTSEPLPQFVDGVQLRLREVNVEVTKAGFMLNPTNCDEQQVSAALGGLQGTGAQVSSKFGIAGCKSLPFHPDFTASTEAHTSKADGASLKVKLTYPAGAYANIAKTVTELPTALPSRLTTLQKACVDKVFEANPAACPEGSVIGYATAHTPVLNQPLVGPAYLVSHGGAEFPDLEIVLQGEGVMVVLDGQTDIKKGITKTTFNAIPDSPVEAFELNLPEGPHSALGANVEPCSTALSLPTILTGQNGAVIKQSTPIVVTGCPPTVTVTKTELKGNVLSLTLKTSSKGTVKISGRGLKTTKKSLAAGTHVIRVPLTKAGRSMRAHHKKTSVKVSLTVGKQAVVAKATSVRL